MLGQNRLWKLKSRKEGKWAGERGASCSGTRPGKRGDGEIGGQQMSGQVTQENKGACVRSLTVYLNKKGEDWKVF